MRGFAITLLFLPGAMGLYGQAFLPSLPDAPSTQLLALQEPQRVPPSHIRTVPCDPATMPADTPAGARPSANPSATPSSRLCFQRVGPYARFVNSQEITPMTVRQKGLLAVHDVIDPVNLATIALSSGIAVAVNAHSAYGPGMRGWGKDAGYGLLQDAQGEAIETFAIASIAHQDPRYHRMPEASRMRRVWHAVRHTYVTRHDDGRPMPNYETLVGFPICSEISNLYVPGIGTNAKSTAERVVIAWAANPADDLITEFLPDLAAHLHLRIVFVQRVLNRVATGQSAP